jgi:FAD/FMN-containing dehydrogenase
MVEARIVLANSTVVTASDTENPDLYWAIKGAGSSMGVVSQFKFKTFKPPEVLTRFNAVLGWNANNSVAGLKRIQKWAAEEMPNEMNARVFLTPQMPNLEGLYYGTKDKMMEILDPLLKEISGILQEAVETDWVGQAGHFGHGLSLDQTHPYNKVSPGMNRGNE